MGLIGRGWKPCEGWSRPVLIGRGLAHNTCCCSHPLCDPEHTTRMVWIVLSVVVAEWGTPGPIPNPEAKPSSADGTAPARVWESRTPPNTTSPQGPPTTPRGPLRAAIDER